MRAARGFTLIEVMTAIAMMMIILGSLWHLPRGFQEFVREDDYRRACVSTRRALRKLPAPTALPPEIHVVPFGLSVTLRNTPAADPLEIYLRGSRLSRSQYRYLPGGRTIVFSPALRGKEVVIHYAISFPVWEEVRAIPRVAPHTIVLSHRPVESIRFVKVANGSALRALSSSQYHFNARENFLELPFHAGKVVLVGYNGGDDVRLSGAFLSPDLKTTSYAPSGWKLVTLSIRPQGGDRWLKFFTIRKM